MSEPIKVGPFLGINNKLPSEKLIVPKEGAFVRDATNVDLTSAGTFQRRGGTTKIVSSARASSLWSNGSKGYFVDSGTLKSFDGTSTAPIKVLGDPTANVSFTDTPRGVVWSDGSLIELITGSSSALLNPSTPNPLPFVSASANGSLSAGFYLLAFANVSADGVRSALSMHYSVSVPADGRINVSAPARPHDTHIFISAANGSHMFQEGVLAAADTSVSFSLVTSQGAPVSSEYEEAMPAGAYVRYYRGRLLTVKGNAVFYSHPFNYGLTHPAKNFILLDGPVTLCEPTQTGVFLATADNTWFLDGQDVATAELKPIAPYGAVPNTAVAEPNSLNMWWMTPRGMVRTNDANTLDMKQDEHIAFSAATNGAALFREENGLSQVISTLSNAAPTGAASASSYMEATTVN